MTFGKRFTTSGGNPARRDPTFQQRTYDEGLGIYDYRNRSFDPATGRFLQRDPVLDEANLYNPYAGMGNNPVGNVDPMGTCNPPGNVDYEEEPEPAPAPHIPLFVPRKLFEDPDRDASIGNLGRNGFVALGMRLELLYTVAKEIGKQVVNASRQVLDDPGAVISARSPRYGSGGSVPYPGTDKRWAEFGAELSVKLNKGAAGASYLLHQALYTRNTPFSAGYYPQDVRRVDDMFADNFPEDEKLLQTTGRAIIKDFNDFMRAPPGKQARLIAGGTWDVGLIFGAPFAKGSGLSKVLPRGFGKTGKLGKFMSFFDEPVRIQWKPTKSLNFRSSLIAAADDPAYITMNPADVRYTQHVASPNFSTGETLTDTVRALRANPAYVNEIPTVRVAYYKGRYWALDNRRLIAFKQAQLSRVTFKKVSLENQSVLKEFLRKWNPIGGEGKMIITTPRAGHRAVKEALRAEKMIQ